MNQSAEMVLIRTLASSGSLSAAAREMELSLSAVSRRLSALESRLGVRLLNRTTRRMTLTSEGQQYLKMAAGILADIATMEETLTASRAAPRGFLRVNASHGFGRMFLASAVSEFAGLYPDLRVQLELSARPLNLVEAGYDVGIRIGHLRDNTLIARKISSNTRIACASPAYLARRGMPKDVADLACHDCIVLHENRDDHAVWPFLAGPRTAAQSIKLQGRLIANDSQIAVQWALDGHGIILRSDYEVGPLLAEGRLVQVLPQHPPGDFSIYAVYAQRRHVPARIRKFIDFLVLRFSGADPSHRVPRIPARSRRA